MVSEQQEVSFGLIAPAVVFLPLWVAERKGFLARLSVADQRRASIYAWNPRVPRRDERFSIWAVG